MEENTLEVGSLEGLTGADNFAQCMEKLGGRVYIFGGDLHLGDYTGHSRDYILEQARNISRILRDGEIASIVVSHGDSLVKPVRFLHGKELSL